jgi:hypothetical protein
MWKPFTVADLVMLVLFAWAWAALGGAPGGTHREPAVGG